MGIRAQTPSVGPHCLSGNPSDSWLEEEDGGVTAEASSLAPDSHRS